jgi:putative ABC transport system permease protein
MIRNYLTSVWRYIARNKTFTALNLMGLVTGITAFLLIMQFVTHELSYDSTWAHGDRVFRVNLDRYDKGELSTRWASGCAGIGPDLKANFPEVEAYVRLTKSNALLAYGDVFFKEDNVYYASQDFFTVFGMPLLAGTDSTALKGLNKMVISQSLAKKYFANEDPVGKTMRNNGRVEYLITGVFDDFPKNSHMQIDALLSFATYAKLVGQPDEASLNQWMWDGFTTYVLLRPDASASALEGKLPDFVIREEGEELKRFNAGMTFTLMPISDIHLDSDFIGEFKANGDRETVYFLTVVAILILVIAWINYVNLATAKSIERAREVGVRKVMGGFRWQLVQQFLMESTLLNTLAVTLSVVAVLLLTPWFNQITGREIGYELFGNVFFWIGCMLLIVVSALLSGLYPAFVLSAFKPVEVLKGRFKNSTRGLVFRKGMVVMQFVASVTLIVGTFTVYHQLRYMQDQQLGINIDQTVVMQSPNIADSTYSNKFEVLKNRFNAHAEVKGVSASSSIPGASPEWNAGGIRRISQREDEQKQYRVIMMDHDFIPLYGLEVVAGRAFSGDTPNEDRNVLLNEAGAKHMGFESIDLALNDQINFWGDTFRIVGVVKNFRQESAKKDFEPLIFRYNRTPGGFYSINFNTANVRESMAKFEQDWKEIFPGNPFNYFFLDDHYNKQYQADQQFGSVFGIFSGLAIFIACLGLFGLSSLTALQRTKEIGVRKVLGASTQSILTLMSKDYLILMSIAIVLAVPLTAFIMNQWLQNFANRVALSWWIFAIPSVLVISVALLTVSFHTIRVAMTNPGQSLRYE